MVGIEDFAHPTTTVGRSAANKRRPMNLHRRTWLAVAGVVGVFALLNLHCWRPGTGGRTDRVGDVQPDGSELELYYGWPACYRAELLRSDDPGLADRVLKSAPFYGPPHADGWVSARAFGWPAVGIDIAFAALGVVLVAALMEWNRSGWSRRAVVAVLVIVVLMAVGFGIADAVGVHL